MNKTITGLTQVTTADIDRTTALMPYVDLTEALPADQTKKISIEQLTGVYVVTGTLLSANALTCGTIPVLAVPAPPAGYYARTLHVDLATDYGTTPYTANKTLVLKTNTATKQQFGFAGAFLSTGSNLVMGQQQNSATATDVQMVDGEGIYWTTQDGANETAGDSDFIYKITYEINPIIP